MNKLIQPYFVLSSQQYFKNVVNNYGISHFYCFEKLASQSNDIIAVPDGCIDIVFNCSDRHPSAEVCGSVLHPTKVLDRHIYYFGVRFYPGSGYTFKDVKMSDIINHTTSFADLFDAKDLIQQIAATRDFHEQIRLFMDHYFKHLHQVEIINDTSPMKSYMLQRIFETKGQLKVRDLAQEMHYSERYINQQFNQYFGIQPKVFSKIIRFQEVLNQLNLSSNTTDSKSLIQIAYDSGYYDQAHMYKDFNAFCHNSPKQYLDLIHDLDYYNRLIVLENKV